LMTGRAVGALLAAPQPAAAQSFDGTSIVVAGNAVVTTNTDLTTVLVFEPETVINWTTIDMGSTGAIDFQPEGTSAFFQPDFNGDYTVLNRILPVDAFGAATSATVTFNGTVKIGRASCRESESVSGV